MMEPRSRLAPEVKAMLRGKGTSTGCGARAGNENYGEFVKGIILPNMKWNLAISGESIKIETMGL